MAKKKTDKPPVATDPRVSQERNAVREPAKDFELVKTEPKPVAPPPLPPIKIRLKRTFGVKPGEFPHVKGTIARAGVVIVNPTEHEKELVKIGWAEVVN